MEKIRVLVADKQALVREGICALLKTCGNMELVGEATNSTEVLEMIAKENPDVVLLDTALPPVDGASVAWQIRKENKRTKVLLLGESEDKDSIVRGIKAGSDGYILKRGTAGDLFFAIMTIHKGNCYLYPSVATKVVEEYLGVGKGPKLDSYDRLSEREKEVLKLIAEGRRSRQIAQILNISPKTVQGHRTSLMRKLGIHSQSEVIKYAIRRHVIDMEV